MTVLAEAPVVDRRIAKIQGYAQRLGAHHRIYDQTGRAQLNLALFRVGGNVRVRRTHISVSVVRRGNFLINLPPGLPERQVRFAVATGIGRYALEHLSQRKFGTMLLLDSDRLAIAKAEAFASAFLMPEPYFRWEHEELDGDVWRLGLAFGVSPKAANARCRTLGLEATNNRGLGPAKSPSFSL